MQNYRVTFGGENIDYRSDFAACRGYWPIIKTVLDALDTFGIEDKWWFFEPYVEITWLCDDPDVAEKAMNEVSRLLGDIEYKKLTPADGVFGDWHGLTPEEREFGAKRYAQLAKTSRCYYENMDVIDKGMGLEKHYSRTTHVLANQLGLNYNAEGVALIKRGLLCLLMFNLGHQPAVDIYEQLFKEKYLGRDEDPS